MKESPSIFVRSPREGGYTYVTTPVFRGFTFLLEPGENDIELNRAFLIYLAIELDARRKRGAKTLDISFVK